MVRIDSECCVRACSSHFVESMKRHNEKVRIFTNILQFYLYVGYIELETNFDWNKLKNLKELYLYGVDGINTEKFIEFLRHHANIEIFHHDRDTFDQSTEDVCKALAKYCGNKIQDYAGKMTYGQENLHYFISGFKNVKKVCLTTHELCGGDLIDAMKMLAANDTIEMLDLEIFSCRILSIVLSKQGEKKII